MSESSPRVSALVVFGILLFVCACHCFAQQGTPTPTASPSPTPLLYSPQTLTDLKRLQQAALNSNYAYRQVAHLANLARIALTPEEISSLTTELDQIVDSIAKVQEVATPDVPATSHPVPLSNVFRPDVVGQTLTIEQALQNAPEHAENRFKVSAILGEEQY